MGIIYYQLIFFFNVLIQLQFQIWNTFNINLTFFKYECIQIELFFEADQRNCRRQFYFSLK